MTLVAGIDVGNSTTEIVVIDDAGTPVVWDRSPTRGRKGSAESGAAAARLLARLERGLGRRADAAILTEQHPVVTTNREVAPITPDTGRLCTLASSGSTPGGHGFGVGRPRDTEDEPATEGPVVLVARDPLGYRRTAVRVAEWIAAGAEVRGVILAGDEARLVATRLKADLPVVDCADAEAALACRLVAVEVATAGAQVRRVSDPIALAADLGLGPAEHEHARNLAAQAQSARAMAVGLLAEPTAATPAVTPTAWAAAPVDTWSVDLLTLATLPGLRPGAVIRPRTVTAALLPADEPDAHVTAFATVWGGPTDRRSSESAAGRRGALTTPGARPDAWVIDLGGGTVDVTSPHDARTAAGSGALLTACVSDVLDVPTGLAEWVKRGPASRVETPHLVVRETGEREFLDAPAPPGSVGWLVAPGPSGELPFSRHLMAGEWRALRRAVKSATVADNLDRLLSAGAGPRGDVLLVGGPAGDDELVEIVNAALPGVVAGRADVAGRLSHRWAVAYGLALAGIDA